MRCDSQGLLPLRTQNPQGGSRGREIGGRQRPRANKQAYYFSNVIATQKGEATVSFILERKSIETTLSLGLGFSQVLT